MDLYFDEKFKNNVIKAWKSNKSELNDIYHHPTTSRIVKKCIDLSCNKPLTRIHDTKIKSISPERWLEAYIIQLAKQNDNYKIPFNLITKNNNPASNYNTNEEYLLLYSQLKFPKDERNRARPLDCLLYNPHANNLVIMELKADRNQRTKAIEELNDYSQKVYGIVEAFSAIFNLGKIHGIEGYIIWPGDNKYRNENLDFNGWGVIGYTAEKIIEKGKLKNPWEYINTTGNKITFTKYQNSKLIKC